MTLVRDFGKSCAGKGGREVERRDYRRCPALLKVPLATARQAGGKRAQLMNSAYDRRRSKGKVYPTAPPFIMLLFYEINRRHARCFRNGIYVIVGGCHSEKSPR